MEKYTTQHLFLYRREMPSHDFRGPPSYDYGHAIKNMIFLKNLISAQTHPTSMNPISAIVQISSIPITSRLWLQLMDIVAEIEIDEKKILGFSTDSSASEFAFSGLAGPSFGKNRMLFIFQPFSRNIWKWFEIWVKIWNKCLMNTKI